MTSIPELSIVVVHHRTPDHLQRCIQALLADVGPAAERESIEIVVVDNSVEGGAGREDLDGVEDSERNGEVSLASRTALAELGSANLSPLALDVVELERNQGFGAACNRGVARATAPRILLLNPDVRISLASARQLASLLEADGQRAAVGCKLTADDGCAEPTWSVPLRFRSEVRRRRFWQNWEARRPAAVAVAEHMQATERDVPWITAACLALRRDAFEQVGGFDERYFLYYEDIDLGEALRRAGWSLRYTPAISARHSRGVSTQRRPDVAKLRRRSRRLFYRKWGSWFDRAALMALHGLRRLTG